MVPPAYREAHERGMERFLASGEAPVVNRRLELDGAASDGRELPIEITITSPMPLGQGYFFGAFLRDISDRLEQEQSCARPRSRPKPRPAPRASSSPA